jgi:hypothetical protein
MDVQQRGELLAATILAEHGESATSSHLEWLSRECTKLLLREARVSAREEALRDQKRPRTRRHRARVPATTREAAAE